METELSKHFPNLYAAHRNLAAKFKCSRLHISQWTRGNSLNTVLTVPSVGQYDSREKQTGERTVPVRSALDYHGNRTFRSLFSFPIVYCAEGPSATEQMEKNVGNPALRKKLITETEIQEFIEKETGKDRLRRMFSKDNQGRRGEEFDVVTLVTAQASGMTFLIMSIFAGYHAKEEFVRKHSATVFKTKFLAFRRMNDAMFLSSLKEGARWGIRVAMFTGTFMLVSQTIAVYRNKSSPWEYVAGGVTTGAILKANLGLKGMVGGAIFGSIFGFIGGLFVYGGMILFSETQQQRHFWKIQALIEEDREMKGQLYIKENVEPPTAVQ